MNVIFLDVDGVLNCRYSKSKCGIYLGCDMDKIRRVKKIVEKTNSIIILTSDWRLNTKHMKYLRRKLGRAKLYTSGVTPNIKRECRGKEIDQWFKDNDDLEIDGWVILDDEWFSDFDNYVGPDKNKLYTHLILTEFEAKNGGLQDEHVEEAIRIIKEGVIDECSKQNKQK